MTEILNLPKCENYEKCGHYAIALWGRLWLCGDCLIKLKEKMDKETDDKMRGYLFEE
jgi:hypothetical protein